MKFNIDEYLRIIKDLLNENMNQEAYAAGLKCARIFWIILSAVVITIIVASMWKILKKESKQ